MTLLQSSFLFLGIFLAHWYVSLFFQTVMHHRFYSHRMFAMSKRLERKMHIMTYLAQGSSYLSRRTYALMHRMHHAFSDTEDDPHSPHHLGRYWKTMFGLMYSMKIRFDYLKHNEAKLAADPKTAPFLKDLPELTPFDRWADSWASRLIFGACYAAPYYFFAEAWWQWILLLAHFIIAPIQGSVVNWFGHKHGHVNFDNDDKSTNTFKKDYALAGELLQNNHHRFPARANFAVYPDEYDPTYSLFLVRLARKGLITFTLAQ